MAQIATNEDIVVKDIRGQHPGGDLIWSCKRRESIEYFLNSTEDTTFASDDVIVSFNLDGEEIVSKWCLEIEPMRESKKKTKGYKHCQIWLTCTQWPKPVSMDIMEFVVSKQIYIPAISYKKFKQESTYTLKDNTRGCVGDLTLDRFKQFNVLNNGGFDIKATFSIHAIKYQYINKNHNNNDNNDDTNGNGKGNIVVSNIRNGNNKYDLSKMLSTIMDRLEEISNKVDGKGNGSSNDEMKGDDSNENENEVVQLMYELFDKDSGKEYVDIIKKEGFDDMAVFCELNENDLKEIGIDKKGHRMKFLTYFKQYKINQQLISNVNNAPALHDTINEGK